MVSEKLDEKAIFNVARRLNSPDARAEYLHQVCGDDQDLFERVETILRAYEEQASFLESPPAGSAPPTIDLPITETRGTVIGPFKLLQQIGEGGMGVVFMAEQTEPLQRTVALKIIKPGMDSRQVIARFEAERQALALMDHPNISRVLDAGTTDTGRPYFVMELVKGIPITEYCDQRQLAVRERLELMATVCQAVQHAHQKGIIHRDIKPTNVLVAEYDGRPVPKVIDFGVAKATAQRLAEKTMFTELGQVLGTMEYMSPEQARFNQLDIDTRSDIYSLGVLVYELLTGSTPFGRKRLNEAAFDEMLRIIREEEPPKPSTRLSSSDALPSIAANRSLEPLKLNRLVQGELDWIVMKALEKDRNRRYESASAFAADVQRHLNDEPVEARPTSLAYRMRKFVRRHRGRVAAAGLSSLLIAAATILGATIYAQRAASQREIVQQVEQSLASARTAIEAGDLRLAERSVAEAQGGLGEHRSSLSTAAADVDKLAAEVDARRADQGRFDKFMEMTLDIQRNIDSNDEGVRDLLDHYGIVSDRKWLDRLNQSYLKPEQKRRVQETAYETLVSLADLSVRTKEGLNEAEQALELLNSAQLFHEPTRAFWFVRRQAHQRMKDDPAARDDDQRFQAAKARTAFDYYLPGRTAGIKGDHEEEIRSYEAALRLQPDHYNSLYWLGSRLRWERKIDRKPEAIAYTTSCISLRPDNPYPYLCRAHCYWKQGHLQEAEADYSTSIDVAACDGERLVPLWVRRKFYQRVGRLDAAKQDLNRFIAISEQELKESQSHAGSVFQISGDMRRLAATYYELGKFDRALILQLKALELAKAEYGPEYYRTRGNVDNIAMLYAAMGKHDEAVQLYKESLEKRRATGYAQSFGFRGILNNLSRSYQAIGKHDQAQKLLEEALRLATAELGTEHFETLISMSRLGDAYRQAGKFDQAIALLKETLELQMEIQGPEHAETLNTMNNLAGAYSDAKKLDQAAAFFGEEFAVRKAKLDREDPQTLASRTNLASAYDIDRILGGLYGISPPGPEQTNTLSAMTNLGRTLLHQQKYTATEPLLLATYAGLKARETRKIDALDKDRLTETLQRLVALYTEWNKPDEAAKWQKELDARKSDQLPSTNSQNVKPKA